MQNPFARKIEENFYDDVDISQITMPNTSGADDGPADKHKRKRHRSSRTKTIGMGFNLNRRREDGELSDISDTELSPGHTQITMVKMSTNEMDIKLKKNPVTYFKTCVYDTNLTVKDDHWHMVVIHQSNRIYSKKHILDALFDVVCDSEFFPIAYRQAKQEDYFFLRMCRVAIGKLFKSGLKIKMPDGKYLYLSMKLCVADYTLGQIYPSSKFLRACMDRFNDLVVFQNTSRVLNLDNLSASPELTEIIINLSNRAHLELLCTTLNNSKELLNSISGLRLSNNNLMNLKPFEILPRTNLQILDLSQNKINDLSQLRYLDKFSFNELLVNANPFTQKNNYENDIQNIFPAIAKINGKPINKLQSTALLSADIPIEVIFLGDVIKGGDIGQNVFFKKYKSSDMWHQVILHHDGKFSKTQLLTAIFHQLTGHEFYPCYYKTGTDIDTFFIRNCFDQMEVLFNAKLIVKISEIGQQIRLTFKMNVANFKADQIDVSEQLTKAMGACFNLMDKTYNLENFSHRDELKNAEVYLSNPRTITFVLLQGCRRFLANIEVLKLNNNNIKTARGMHPLNWLKKLRTMDLSNNKIDSLADIEMIPKIPVTEVWLVGNPLCKRDTIAADYVAKVKKIFPDIKQLDGDNLYLDGSVIFQKNYLCSPDGYDLVEQFINHYFTTFDSLGRHHIKGVYHDQAILTLSANFIGISRSNEDHIRPYINCSRNISKPVKCFWDKVYYGPEQIVSTYRSFGSSEHDFRSFTIDLLHYTPTTAVITVNGLFKEQGATLNEEELVLGFVRTFVLKLTASGLGMFRRSCEFKIANEQVLFYRPSIAQLRNAFKNPTILEEPSITNTDKEGLIVIFEELTSLAPSWCARCLKESDWHFKSALELFIHLCQENKLPDHAFKFGKM